MKPLVSIIMGSTSDLPVMEKAALFLNDMEIPFEMNALSAHRTPEEVERFAKEAKERGESDNRRRRNGSTFVWCDRFDDYPSGNWRSD